MGKTSVICRSAGTGIPEKGEYKECLKTGSGRVTACEVSVVGSSSTKIEIVPKSLEETRELIERFADYIEQKNSDEVKKLKSDDIFPTELLRIINNMLGFKKDKNDKTDPALKAFNESGDRDAFIETCWKK